MQRIFVRRNCLIIGLVLAFSHFAPAQNKELTADETIAIPKVEFDAQGELKITASPNSSPNDFDFLVGKWTMHNRHLNKRLANCHDWTEFDSSDVNMKILNGAADMDTYSTTQFPGMVGKLFEGLPAIVRSEDTTLESLLDCEQHGKDRTSSCRFVRPKRRGPLFWQRHVQRQTDYRRLPLGCAEQRASAVGSG